MFVSRKNLKPEQWSKTATDWASELQANTPALHHTCPGGRCQGTQCGASVAHPKRVSAGHHSRLVHAVLATACLKATYLELCASTIAEEMISSFTPFFRKLLINAETSILLSSFSRSARNP